MVEITVSVTANGLSHPQLSVAYVPPDIFMKVSSEEFPTPKLFPFGMFYHTEEERVSSPTSASLLEDWASPEPHTKSLLNPICCKTQRSEQRGVVAWKRQTTAISPFKQVSGETISKG